MNELKQIINKLKLIPLEPEGGYFSETFRHPQLFLPKTAGYDIVENRNLFTNIYYLITPESFSSPHILKSDEIWNFYFGDPVCLYLLSSDGEVKRLKLGANLSEDYSFQAVVPRNTIQCSHLVDNGKYALIGTTVIPGFDFNDFNLVEEEFLKIKYPDFIERKKFFK